jgi:hypothetical protein
MARNYRYISADSHFESPPEQWTHRVSKQYRDRASRRIKLADGRDALQIEGDRLVYGGTSLYGGRPAETFDPSIMDYDNTPGCGSAEQRLREQDERRRRRNTVLPWRQKPGDQGQSSIFRYRPRLQRLPGGRVLCLGPGPPRRHGRPPERRKMAAGNAIKFFRLDQESD